MSRAGRGSGPEAKRREVEARVAAAAHQHAHPAPEVPEEARVAFLAQQLHIRCKAVIVNRYPSLWPGESIGAALAEQWMQLLMQRMQEEAQASRVIVPT